MVRCGSAERPLLRQHLAFRLRFQEELVPRPVVHGNIPVAHQECGERDHAGRDPCIRVHRVRVRRVRKHRCHEKYGLELHDIFSLVHMRGDRYPEVFPASLLKYSVVGMDINMLWYKYYDHTNYYRCERLLSVASHCD